MWIRMSIWAGDWGVKCRMGITRGRRVAQEVNEEMVWTRLWAQG